VQALLLPVGSEWYGVEATAVREVVAAPLVVPLPTAPPSVLGVLNLRGEIVPLFDTAALLGVGAFSDHPFVAVVETALGPAGLNATAVPEAAMLAEQASAAELPGAVGVYAHYGRLVVVVDPEVILAPARVGGWS
jgi:purine-binding chemotaxis protein CheW